MDLNGKYAPSDLRRLLEKTSLTKHCERPCYGIEAPLPAYYAADENKRVLVLDPASDDTNDLKLQSIQKALSYLQGLSPEKIIIPIAEGQKILGLFPRNHWVTLYYDHQQNKAILLDSRPRWISFLYPTSSMKKLLIAGLREVYSEEIANNMQFGISYQAVQYNDTYCGAWTVANIRSLASGHDIAASKKAFTWRDEENIFSDQNPQQKHIHKWNFWQKIIVSLLVALGLAKRKQADEFSAGSYQNMANDLKSNTNNNSDNNSDENAEDFAFIPDTKVKVSGSVQDNLQDPLLENNGKSCTEEQQIVQNASFK